MPCDESKYSFTVGETTSPGVVYCGIIKDRPFVEFNYWRLFVIFCLTCNLINENIPYYSC